MKTTLYLPKVVTNTDVSYKVLGPDDSVLDERKGTACFSSITYHAIDPTAKKILVYRRLDTIPYDLATIKRWIAALKDLGFPCRVRTPKDKDMIHFIIDLKAYAYKMHVTSTLQLLRCLFETYICYVPEFYFADEQDDRFLALQMAHYRLWKEEELGYANSNHTITCKGAKPVTKDQLFKRIAATKFGTFEDAKYERCDAMWNGSVPDKT